jgi:hypothetical protein
MTGARRELFAQWFWVSGLVLWLTLAVAFGLHRKWDYFGLSVLWVMSSLVGWSRSQGHART